jgi:hypothetical protein
VFDRYKRCRAGLDRGIGKMFVKAVSTTRVGEAIEAFTKIKPGLSGHRPRQLQDAGSSIGVA